MSIRFFLGANSGDGFRSLYPQFVNLREIHDFLILKGGPGVGKSTFMKAVAQSAEEAGAVVEYIHCSGDPDSLDAVWIPACNTAVADGTSPHVIEAQYPAAVDRYVNLGCFYDVEAAKACRQAIVHHADTYRAAYQRAFRRLKAARQVECDAAELVQLNQVKADRRVRGIISRELRRKSRESGRTTYRFLGSVTYQGYVCFFETVEELCPKVYVMADRYHLAGGMLRQLHEHAIAAGYDVIACPDPEDPKTLRHLLIPDAEIAFVTSDDLETYGGKCYRRIRVDAMAEIDNRSQLRFSMRMAAILRAEAIEALQEAKKAHDALEAVYNPYVDFHGVEALSREETARILSYLDGE